MNIEIKKLSDLKPAPYNPRKSNEKQEKHLTESLTKFGVVEPIIFNKQTGFIIGGHFRVRELKKLGYKDVECVILDLSPEEEKELNIRLNANTGEFDFEMLQEWDKEELAGWGLDFGDNEQDDFYTSKVESPIYTPKKEIPEIEGLCNLGNYNKLICDIEKSNITDKEKIFLKLAATRHIVFDYSEIAEFYSHSEKDVQDLMENSALIIIDYDKAIELGFVQLHKTLSELMNEE